MPDAILKAGGKVWQRSGFSVQQTGSFKPRIARILTDFLNSRAESQSRRGGRERRKCLKAWVLSRFDTDFTNFLTVGPNIPDRGGRPIFDLRMTMYDWKHFLRYAGGCISRWASLLPERVAALAEAAYVKDHIFPTWRKTGWTPHFAASNRAKCCIFHQNGRGVFEHEKTEEEMSNTKSEDPPRPARIRFNSLPANDIFFRWTPNP
jgi:hypothetical protein